MCKFSQHAAHSNSPPMEGCPKGGVVILLDLDTIEISNIINCIQ